MKGPEYDPTTDANRMVWGKVTVRITNVSQPNMAAYLADASFFSEGGHGFGLRSTELPASHWPTLAETWLHTIHILR